ncbi:MAG: hypothetical protein ACE5KH_00480 [Candidatus Geothermarchaeales archaeon]
MPFRGRTETLVFKILLLGALLLSSLSVPYPTSAEEGTLVILGDQILRISGDYFIDQDILLEEQATLIFEDANIALSGNHTITCRDNARLLVANSDFVVQAVATQRVLRPASFRMELTDSCAAEIDSSVVLFEGHSLPLWLNLFSASTATVTDSDLTLITLSNDTSVTLINSQQIQFQLRDHASLVAMNSTVLRPHLVFGGDTVAVVKGLPQGNVDFWSLQLNETLQGSRMDLTLINSSVDRPWRIWGEERAHVLVAETEVEEVLARGFSYIELISPTGVSFPWALENGIIEVKWTVLLQMIGVGLAPLGGANVTIDEPHWRPDIGPYGETTRMSSVITGRNGSLKIILTGRSMAGSEGDQWYRYIVTVSHLDAVLTEMIWPREDTTMVFDFDEDRDGLLLGEELSWGTSSELPDSDRDRLLDGEEVKLYGTDPLNVDTDGDGLEDDEELRVGADPLRKDADSDLWPDPLDISPKNPLIPNAEITLSALLLGVAAIYVRRIRNRR